MLGLDDSIFEYALYDVLHALGATTANAVELDALRSEWRTTGLRHSDLYLALDLLTTAGSLEISRPGAWLLTETGAQRLMLASSTSQSTMADQVARSVLKVIRERMPASVRDSRPSVQRRRLSSHVRVRDTSRIGQH